MPDKTDTTTMPENLQTPRGAEPAQPSEILTQTSNVCNAGRQEKTQVSKIGNDPSNGVGPWPGGKEAWPEGEHWDPELLEFGDHRNVEDRFRYWKRDYVRDFLDQTRFPFHVAIENLDHDFNIGSIVRSANAFGAAAVHIIGAHRWNKRGAMVTDRYQHVDHFPTTLGFVNWAQSAGLRIIGIDNVEQSQPLEQVELPASSVLVFGSEKNGLSEEMLAVCEGVYAISQYGSTRSINVGAAAAVAMYAWVISNT